VLVATHIGSADPDDWTRKAIDQNVGCSIDAWRVPDRNSFLDASFRLSWLPSQLALVVARKSLWGDSLTVSSLQA